MRPFIERQLWLSSFLLEELCRNFGYSLNWALLEVKMTSFGWMGDRKPFAVQAKSFMP